MALSNIREVARIAGVSVATVSRTLASPDRVSPGTRDRVNAAIEQAGYRPNLLAVQFRSRKTFNIVILVPQIANAFFARVISGAQRAAQACGYRILLCDTQGDERVEKEFANLVYAHQADGVIQLRANDPFADLVDGQQPPLVNACEVIKGGRYPTVSLDNFGAARSITTLLIESGHTRIGLIKGPEHSPLTRDRVAGYEEAHRHANLALDPSLMCEGDFSLRAGYEGAAILLNLPVRPTAIFCENDEMAFGALKRIKEQGLRVPDDCSLVGFDDIEMASYCDPPLTTVSQPAEEFGQRAVEMLKALIENEPLLERHRVLPFKIMMRDSLRSI